MWSASSLRRYAASLSLGLAAACPAFGQVSGAIFTTLEDGTAVNKNIYADKCLVYLDGGPGPNAPADAAGLPDGEYYFQVTDPSGKTLLSTDPLTNRRFSVSGGIITAYTGGGAHDTGDDVDNGAVTIGLCPYANTPNRGGEYKVWVTPVSGLFTGCSPSAVDCGLGKGPVKHFHGFIPSLTKTDNFKVRGTPGACLVVVKRNDLNGDGDISGDPTIAWPITVMGPLGDTIKGEVYTSEDGKKLITEYCNLVNGKYTVTEGDVKDWTVTATVLDGVAITPPTTTVVVQINGSDRRLEFGNCLGDKKNTCTGKK